LEHQNHLLEKRPSFSVPWHFKRGVWEGGGRFSMWKTKEKFYVKKFKHARNKN
jgi:hypothetical protein